MSENNAVRKPLSNEQLNRVFHALSDPTRRAIVARLRAREGTVSALAGPFDMSLNAVSKHLKVLESADLIEREIIGRTSVCSLRAEVLEDANSWIEQYTRFWTETLDSFEAHMEDQFGGQQGALEDEDRNAG